MKMEELALGKEDDAASRDRLETLRQNLADKQEQLTPSPPVGSRRRPA